jgi:O-antigen/teichoic acid export membrane protein
MKHRLVLGTIFTAISSGWGILISLFLTPFLIHTLGKASYGIWVLVISFTVTSGLLSLLDFGVQSSVVKFFAEYHAKGEKNKVAQIISASLYFFLGIGMIGAIGTALFAWLFFTQVFSLPPHLADEGRLLLSILAIQTFFEFPGLIFLAVLEGLQQFVLIRILTIVQHGLYAGLVILMVLLDHGVVSLGIAMLVASGTKFLIAGVSVWRFLPDLRLTWHFDRGMLRHIIGFSGKMFFIRILAVIYNQMDKIIIGIILTSTLLTDYDIAYKIRMLALVSLSFVTPQIIAPASSLHAANNHPRLQELFLKGTKYSLAISLPVIASAFILSRSIIHVWIGPEYTYNTAIAQLFLSYLFLVAAIDVGQNIMLGIGHVRAIMWIMVPTVGINLVVSIFLAPRLGIAGVIWGTVIGMVIAFFPYLWYYLKTLDISLSRFLREVVFPTYPVALAFALILFLGYRIVQPDTLWSLALLGIAGMGIYGGLFMLFGLSTGERNDLFNTVLLRRS